MYVYVYIYIIRLNKDIYTAIGEWSSPYESDSKEFVRTSRLTKPSQESFGTKWWGMCRRPLLCVHWEIFFLWRVGSTETRLNATQRKVMTFAKHQKQLAHFKHPLAILKWNSWTDTSFFLRSQLVPYLGLLRSTPAAWRLFHHPGALPWIPAGATQWFLGRIHGSSGEFTDETIEKPWFSWEKHGKNSWRNPFQGWFSHAHRWWCLKFMYSNFYDKQRARNLQLITTKNNWCKKL